MGAMDERWVADPAGADRIVNMYHPPDGAWRTAGGYESAFTPESQFGPVLSVHWFGQHQGGRQWLVYERQTSNTVELRYADYSADASVLIQSGRALIRGPRAGTTYFERANWLYVLNGYDPPVRWNGKEVVEVGFSITPPPPTLSISGFDQADADYSGQPVYDSAGFQRGVGTAASTATRWSYGYAVTWLNDIGQESPPSPIVFIENLNPRDPTAEEALAGVPIQGKRSVLVYIPAAPANVRGMRLYRTADVQGASAVGQQGFTLYFHSQYAAGEVSVNDDLQDSELFTVLDRDQLGLWPTSARYAQMFKGTMFTDGGVEFPSRVRFSPPGNPEQMPEVNYLQVGDAKTGPIMGFKSTRNALVVFKRRGIYLIKGSPLDGFRTDTLTEDVGCAGARSIVEVPGVGTLFVSDEGPYILEGALENTGTPTRATFIGEPIAKVWRTEVNKKALEGCRASRYLKDREVWLQVPAGGDDRPRLGLIFHYTTGGWSVREDYPFSCMTEGRDHRGLLFAGSWDDTNHPGIHVYTRGADLGGANLSSRYETSWVDLGKRTLVEHVEWDVLNLGRSLTMEWHVDRDVAVWQSGADTAVRQRDTELNRSRWGTAVWDAGAFEPLVPVKLRYDVYKSNAFEFQTRLVGGHLAVLGRELVVKASFSETKKRSR